ncbi:uncharacterized protein LOC128857384 [Anastrepha ludens]|uniref:uncharacterized protein LOC128857384 n=1 Tax=Anastrepha ludens TaxID=28586 RepID=UPI0023AEFD70|nr:uncharacterized protein LOC128857384 [Anastrepha ludens]
MEKRQLRNSEVKSSEWIKCQSKKRPGKYYMFNKTTGETKWCSELIDGDATTNANEKPLSPQKCTTKMLRTPAQDRLKRLQQNLKKGRKEMVSQKQNKSQRGRSQDKDVAIKEGIENNVPQETDMKKSRNSKSKSLKADNNIELRKDSQPSTSKGALLGKVEKDKSLKISTPNKSIQISPKNERKRRAWSNAILASETVTTSPKRVKQEETHKDKSEDVKNKPNTSQRTTASLSIGSSIVSKIKAICKSTFNKYCNTKTALSQKPLEVCVDKNNLKICRKETHIRPKVHLALRNNATEIEGDGENDVSNKRKAASTAPMAIVMKGTATPNNGSPSVDFKAVALTASPSQIFGTPNNLLVPAYERGSANTRLERLRNSLRQQELPNNNELNTPTRICASACSSALAVVLRDSAMASGTNCSVDEPMDWMPIEEMKPDIIEISSNESSNAEPSVRSQASDTMGEYYGVVNENLLRYAVEQKLDATTANRKWLNGFYYFVLDTNVLLQHLTFIEELSHMKLCETRGTVLFIPYCVLQELDKLKQFAVGDGTKVLAVRAIKYLNAKFEAKIKHIQAQSALSELDHLVEVNSPDDRIINCCLQAKQHVDHVILLTEDINLRNKAICNNILVSTKSDLIAKHA